MLSKLLHKSRAPDNPASPQTIAANGKWIALAIFFIAAHHINASSCHHKSIRHTGYG